MTNIIVGGSVRCGKVMEFHLRKLYYQVQKYLEYIFNAPSTINHIITYYSVSVDTIYPMKMSILFNGKIIKEFYG